MSTVYIFQSRSELDASANLSGFVEFCKNKLTVFGANLQFEAVVWDLTEYIDRKGLKGRQRVTFSTLDTARRKKFQAMNAEFVLFAKAYFLYRQALRKTLTYGRLLAALRVLEAALIKIYSNGDPTRIDAVALNYAAQLASKNFTRQVAYQICGYLEELCIFMTDNNLLVTPTLWVSPLSKPTDQNIRVGSEFDERRKNKLPSQAALEAIPRIFCNPSNKVDKLISSTAAILLSSPTRINELLNLPVDCEICQTQGEGEPEAYGLRWLPSKGAKIKPPWIVPSMIAIVKKAIENMREITKEARAIATWYEKNPNDVYLPAKFEYLRSRDRFELGEITRLFSLRDLPAARDWCKARKIPIYHSGASEKMKFQDFKSAILSMLPQGFPIYDKGSNLKYSEALMVTRLNELHAVRALNPCMIQAVTTNMVNNHLGTPTKQSIFTRNGYYEPDGSLILVSTHQLRHYLNYLAQEGCLSQLDVAIWSGRKSIQQNDDYNHLTTSEMLAIVHDTVGVESDFFGPLASLPKTLPVSRDEFATLRAPTMHVTDIGFCIHDFSLLPCEKMRQCIMCEDLLSVKGIKEHEHAVRNALNETKRLVLEAQEAHGKEFYGADKWLENQQVAQLRLQALCDRFDNPNIANNSLIQLPPLVMGELESSQGLKALIGGNSEKS